MTIHTPSRVRPPTARATMNMPIPPQSIRTNIMALNYQTFCPESIPVSPIKQSRCQNQQPPPQKRDQTARHERHAKQAVKLKGDAHSSGPYQSSTRLQIAAPITSPAKIQNSRLKSSPIMQVKFGPI